MKILDFLVINYDLKDMMGRTLMSKKITNGISRRTFLKGAAVGAGATAATAFGRVESARAADQPAAAGTATYSFETPPAPIPSSEIKESVTADIVVVGAGISGMTATMAASETGAETILVEKHITWNARGRFNAAIDSGLQKKLGIDLDKEEIILELMKYAGNKPDQRLLRLWANNSGKVMDWMMDMAKAAGLETTMFLWPPPEGFDNSSENYKEYPVAHAIGGERAGEGVLVQLLETNAKNLGADIRYNTRAVQLVRQGKGRVTGVVATSESGEYILFNARRGVILCTGDYGHDPEMMEKYCPAAADIARTRNDFKPAVNTGDGHKMAMWVGAVMERAPHAPMDHGGGAPLGTDPFLQVNQNGERFQNEDVPVQSLANALFNQPEWKYWQVFDSKWPEEVPKMGWGFRRIWEATEQTKALLEMSIGRDDGQGRGRSVKADTIEELAQKMDVPVDTFKATVARYNELARNGRDTDFGKRADRLTTVDKPPFYAGVGNPAFLVAIGGLIVNPKLQALDADSEVIPGLYMAGNTVGRFYGNDYPTMCAGLSHGMCWTFGYLAAKNASADENAETVI